MIAEDISDSVRAAMLTRVIDHPVPAVLDTDAGNQVDDQFALVYALLSEHVDLQAVYAAPFSGRGVSGPGEGMDRSFAEIRNILDLVGVPHAGFAFQGACAFMAGPAAPVSSPAVDDLVARALSHDGDNPLYVLSIGAPTNVSSAIVQDPAIRDRIVVVWLGGNGPSVPLWDDFNCRQDVHAARVLLDSGVPLVRIPCKGVCDQLTTTRDELHTEVAPRGTTGAHLYRLFDEAAPPGGDAKRVVWDISVVAWVINPGWFRGDLVTSPRLADDLRRCDDPARHGMHVIRDLNREAIFRDVFSVLARGSTCLS